jgi:D-alanyl-D-alanine carboxypeptidase
MPLARHRAVAASLLASLALVPPAAAGPYIIADLETGQVLDHEDATRPWYPASLSKLMTAYVVLEAIRAGRVSFDTTIVYSANAQKEPPSKMGFPVGQKVTIDNALKIMLVKSANDVAVMLAEGVGGSVDAFAAEMNQAARRLGMASSNFVNPNGLFDPRQVSSARDMAVLAKAILDQYPEQARYFGLQSIKLGKRTIRGYNALLGRYRGADGMKTGFVCPSGFNIVATAQRDGKHLVAVVLGAHSARDRTEKAAEMFEKEFSADWNPFARRGGPGLLALPASGYSEPYNMREEICSAEARKKRIQVASEAEEVSGGEGKSKDGALVAAAAAHSKPPLLAAVAAVMPPEPVFLGPNPAKPTTPAPTLPAYAAAPSGKPGVTNAPLGVVALDPSTTAFAATNTNSTTRSLKPRPVANVPLPRPKPPI